MVEVPVVGDTVPGKQQRTAVDLPVLRREAPPEVRMEVVQGAGLAACRCLGLGRYGMVLGYAWLVLDAWGAAKLTGFLEDENCHSYGSRSECGMGTAVGSKRAVTQQQKAITFSGIFSGQGNPVLMWKNFLLMIWARI